MVKPYLFNKFAIEISQLSNVSIKTTEKSLDQVWRLSYPTLHDLFCEVNSNDFQDMNRDKILA